MSKRNEARETIEDALRGDQRVLEWGWEMRGGGHQGCRIKLHNGQSCLVVISSTASDHRAIKNMLTDVRRGVQTAWDRG